MTRLFAGAVICILQIRKQLNNRGFNFSKLGCPNPPTRTPTPTEPIGGFAPRAEFVLIQSCGYACFWGLLGCLAGVWRVFEVAAKVVNLTALNGLVGSADLFVT